MIKKLFIFISLIFVLSSCITSSSTNRGSLSDAMDKSKDDYEEERVVPSNDDTDYWNNNNEDNNVISTLDINWEPEDMVVLFRGGSSIISGPYFDKSTGAETLFGWEEGQSSLYFYGGLEILELNKNNSIIESIKENPSMFTGGIEFRYYPIDNLNFFSPYILGRVGGMLLFWEFKNTLYDGLESINSDIVGGITIDTGIGVDLIHTENLRFGILCKPQSYLYSDETSQGFINDYFSVSGLVNISAEIGYKF